MYINQTEKEFLNKIKSMASVDIVQFLMNEGLQLKADPVPQNWLVTLPIEFEASTPAEAVREFIALVENDGLWDWTYLVKDENGKEMYLDAFDLDEDSN